MAMQTAKGWIAALGVAVVILFSPATAEAEDAASAKTDVARPSVEEAATQMPVQNAREGSSPSTGTATEGVGAAATGLAAGGSLLLRVGVEAESVKADAQAPRRPSGNLHRQGRW